MSYSTLKPLLADTAVTSTATYTASDAVVTSTNVANFGKTFRQVRVENINIKITTAPGAGSPNTNMVFLNGTHTFATATIGTNTAGVTVSATMVGSRANIAGGVEPTLNLVSTGTASSTVGVTQGVFDIWFEI